MLRQPTTHNIIFIRTCTTLAKHGLWHKPSKSRPPKKKMTYMHAIVAMIQPIKARPEVFNMESNSNSRQCLQQESGKNAISARYNQLRLDLGISLQLDIQI